MTKDVCGLALSWWNTTPFRFVNSGRFSSTALFNFVSCSIRQQCIIRQQNWSFGWVIRVQNRQFLCNLTKLITKPSFDEYQFLMFFELIHVACSTIFSAWYCCKQPIFHRQLSVILKMNHFHYVSLANRSC